MAAKRNTARVVQPETTRETNSKSRTTLTDNRDANHQERAPAADLNRVIHERMRLGIISALAVNNALTFSDLRDLMQTTDGNLSIHARRLEEAGYITCTKGFDGRTPKTEYKITTAGRKALEAYINHMEALINMTRRA